MTKGPGGKYDDEAEMLLLAHSADMVMVAMLGGVRGSGFSVAGVKPENAAELVFTLRMIADQIEKDTHQ